jgi:hypothetical protein
MSGEGAPSSLMLSLRSAPTRIQWSSEEATTRESGEMHAYRVPGVGKIEVEHLVLTGER